MADDPLIQRKQEQRVRLMRALYGYVDGKEGRSIPPQQWLLLGERAAIPKDETPEVMRFLLSDGLVANKPASQAVCLTHQGIIFVEDHASRLAAERNSKLAVLPSKILAVLESAGDTLQLVQLRSALPEFKELPDEDWLSALNDLRSRGTVVFESAAGSAGQPVLTSLFFGIGNRRQINLSDTPRINVVTLSGEVFEFAYQRKEAAENRDGVLYLCHVNDQKKGRGLRRIMLFRGGATDYYAKDYDTRIDIVRLNSIRRSFDSKLISFDTPYDPERYIELQLQQSDFRKGSPATDERIRNFIKLTAYWLGYKLSSNINRYFVRFDDERDLEYLNTTRDDVRRTVWFLQKQGYLDSSEIPGNGVPTLKLIEEMESSEAKAMSSTRTRLSDGSRDVFVVHGHDQAMQQTVARFLEKLQLKPIILSEQASKGRTIIEKFEDHSSVRFAVVLLSPDDTGAAKDETPKPRARQNVILELGYFIGALGRENVCALHKGGVELPSDLHGVIWVPYEGDWQLALIRELKAAGIDIDLSAAFQ